ncbi:MAG TPA: hypothetical protein VMZ92_18590 [Planctomycetota bacterium]|nr:hypothetical protein [Planctomycetota bacterium]
MADKESKRKGCLDQLLRVLPKSGPWEAWLEETGELPPDFDALPSCARLPDPLEGVTSAAGWPARRDQLRKHFMQWIIGTVPPPPDDLTATVTAERKENGATTREVLLTFAGGKATLRLELFIPDGRGPFPVFMTQFTHRGWAQIAVRRGYVGCVYAGCDSHDDTDTFVDAYPDYDFSRLTRRAWAASRCLDYLANVPEADETSVCITGHSRNGKLSCIASALDERFAAMISSSSGAGGSLPTRYYSEQHFGEGIAAITTSFPDWFHPRWRFFTGREHKLPVDLHELVAMSAPRPVLLSIALNDMVEDARAMQMMYRSAKRVYDLLGAADNIRILWRWGQHDTTPKTIERYLDWCDVHFRGASHEFPERFIVPDDWDAWRARTTTAASAGDFPERDLSDLADVKDLSAWAKRKEEIRSNVRWLLGDAPPEVAHEPKDGYGKERFYNAAICRRWEVPDGLEKEQLVAGEYFSLDVVAPKGTKDSGEKLPTLLWLPPACGSQGYVEADTPRHAWWQVPPREGIVLAAFDPIGHGIRLEEAEGFYARHQDWSLLGKMARDVSAAVTALLNLPYVDSGRLYAFGFSMGALVGLVSAALDERISGLVTLCGPAPFRLETDEAETGGLRRWSEDTMLLPRLGLFIGEEARVPSDVHQLMACVAPRPQLVISPTLDRESPIELVTLAVDAARVIYELLGTADKLEQNSIEDYARFAEATEPVVLDWIRKQAGV